MNVLPRIFSPWEVTALDIAPVLLLAVASAIVMVMIAVRLALVISRW